MKNRKIVYWIFFFIAFITSSLLAQDDCDKCPNCQTKLLKGQQDLAKAKEDMEDGYKKKLANSISKSELEKVKAENTRLLGVSSENSTLNTQLIDTRNASDNLKKEIITLKEQIRLKTEEAEIRQREVEKQKNELEKQKKEIERLNYIISGNICRINWLDDRISKLQGKIFLKEFGVTNLFAPNDANSELCFITFQDKTTTIKEIKVGKEIITDPTMIQCILSRIENLYSHYQDLFYLRFTVRYRDSKNPIKEKFGSVQDKFFKRLFASDKANKEKSLAGDIEIKNYTIAKWGRSSVEGISIAISAEKEDSDEDLLKR